MPVEIRVTGAEQMRALGRDLRAAGEEGKGLRRELLRGFRAASLPLREALQASAIESLPKRGGLNEWVASSKITTRVGFVGSRAGVRIVAKKGAQTVAMDDGSFRHPVFGNKKVWASETVRAGWFTRPLQEKAPAFQEALLTGVEITARRIANK